MSLLDLAETCRHGSDNKVIDECVRNLPALGPLRFGPWRSGSIPWSARAWTPGPNLVLGDPWLSRLVGRAEGIRAGAEIRSDGPCEWLAITAFDGTELLRCELLSTSDFCAWEQLLVKLGVAPTPAPIHAFRPRGYDGPSRTFLGRPFSAAWTGRVHAEFEVGLLRLTCRPSAAPRARGRLG